MYYSYFYYENALKIQEKVIVGFLNFMLVV